MHKFIGAGAYALAFLLLVGSSVPAWAQRTTATFAGIVADNSGGVLPGADVALTNEGTGIVERQVTSATGEFIFNYVPGGTYTLTIAIAGFKTFTAKGISLGAAQSVRRTFSSGSWRNRRERHGQRRGAAHQYRLGRAADQPGSAGGEHAPVRQPESDEPAQSWHRLDEAGRDGRRRWLRQRRRRRHSPETQRAWRRGHVHHRQWHRCERQRRRAADFPVQRHQQDRHREHRIGRRGADRQGHFAGRVRPGPGRQSQHHHQGRHERLAREPVSPL